MLTSRPPEEQNIPLYAVGGRIERWRHHGDGEKGERSLHFGVHVKPPTSGEARIPVIYLSFAVKAANR